MRHVTSFILSRFEVIYGRTGKYHNKGFGGKSRSRRFVEQRERIGRVFKERPRESEQATSETSSKSPASRVPALTCLRSWATLSTQFPSSTLAPNERMVRAPHPLPQYLCFQVDWARPRMRLDSTSRKYGRRLTSIAGRLPSRSRSGQLGSTGLGQHHVAGGG